MSTVYDDPVMTDSTGQDIVTKLDTIAGLMGDGVIDDTSTATDKTWSASKINTQLGTKANADLVPTGASTSNKLATASDVTGLQDNVIANTKLIKDTVGWSGKNLFDFASFATTAVRCTYTFTSSTGTYFLKVTDASDNSQVQIVFNNDILRKYAGKDVRISIASHTKSNPNMVPYIALYKNDILVDNFGGNGIPKSSFTFTVPSTIESSDVFLFVIRANQNQSASVNDTLTVTGLMASLANILDDTYEPYFGSTAFPRSEQAVLGAKNLIPNTLASQTKNGIEIVVDSDGVITANNQASAKTTFEICKCNLKEGQTYKLNGLPNGSNDYTFYYWYGVRNSADTAWLLNGRLYEDTEFTVPSGAGYFKLELEIANGYTSNNLKVYPMLRLATDTDPTYQPYAMTNKELTDSKVDWASYAKTGAINYLNAPNKTITGSGDFIVDNTPISLPAGTYKFSFEVNGTVSSGRQYVLTDRTSGSANVLTGNLKSGHNEITFTTATDITKIKAYENETTNELTFSNFMIADADYNGEYVPYAMTNRELTNNKAEIDTTAFQQVNISSATYSTASGGEPTGISGKLIFKPLVKTADRMILSVNAYLSFTGVQGVNTEQVYEINPNGKTIRELINTAFSASYSTIQGNGNISGQHAFTNAGVYTANIENMNIGNRIYMQFIPKASAFMFGAHFLVTVY